MHKLKIKENSLGGTIPNDIRLHGSNKWDFIGKTKIAI